MTLKEIIKEIEPIFASEWEEREGRKVPEADDISLTNAAVKLSGTVLYADMVDSTGLVDGFKPWFAAEIYKGYLLGASRVIRRNGGEITAFDGDRVMAVFVGDYKNTSAARCALKINHAVVKIINPAIKTKFSTDYSVKHSVGVDTSTLFVAKTGIRGSN